MEQNEFLDALAFLDTEKGLAYCGGSEEFYREILAAYVENSRLDPLKSLFTEENWENYRISIHALKSASLTIGASVFAEECRKLEYAARDLDLQYLRAHHMHVMLKYQHLLSSISQVLAEVTDQPGKGKSASFLNSGSADILVVDDDEINRRTATNILSEHLTVATAASGREALEYLRNSHPKLILLDLHMPDMSGFQVMGLLQKNEETKEIPVVFLTADKDIEAEVESFRLGAMDFITKPFIKEIMLRRVTRILELDRLQKHLQQQVDRQTRRARERQRKLERITHQVIQALADTVDAKDRYTNGHSLRVAKYASEIALRMGMSRQDQENIYYTGMLHDIGKIGVPDEIINKPGRLTDEEYEIIKTHPVIGSEILKNISEIPGLCVGTRGHHERYDGRGYPDGLKGEEIPIQARVIAVADAYDAMTSNRSYRSLLPQDVVRQQIVEGRGTQHDPKISDIMLSMIDEDVNYTMHE